MLGQIRGTLTFSTSLSSHTLVIIVSLYLQYTRVVCVFILILVTKNYVAITALLANVTSNLVRSS